MMLMPRGPSAVPTGGAGFAWPAGICNLIRAITSFAIKLLTPFDLPVFEFDWRRAAENCHRDAQFTAFRIDFFHDAVLILEWTVRDFDRFAALKADFRFHFLLGLLHLREHRFHFGLPHRDRFVFRAGKTNHPRRFTNEIPGATDE